MRLMRILLAIFLAAAALSANAQGIGPPAGNFANETTPSGLKITFVPAYKGTALAGQTIIYAIYIDNVADRTLDRVDVTLALTGVNPLRLAASCTGVTCPEGPQAGAPTQTLQNFSAGGEARLVVQVQVMGPDQFQTNVITRVPGSTPATTTFSTLVLAPPTPPVPPTNGVVPPIVDNQPDIASNNPVQAGNDTVSIQTNDVANVPALNALVPDNNLTPSPAPQPIFGWPPPDWLIVALAAGGVTLVAGVVGVSQWRRYQQRVWRRTLTFDSALDEAIEAAPSALPEAAPTLSVEAVLQDGASGPRGPIEIRRIG
jgi:hypothetical protein